MKYLDLSKPHAYLIWRGKQKAIVSPELLPVGEKMLIIQDSKEAFGEVVLGKPAQISITEFERLEEEHSTRPEERKLKWPNQDSFFLYRFKDWYPFPDARDIEIDNGSAELLPIPELSEEESKLLEQAERLPKTLVLKDEAVILEDGQVSFCEGLDGSKVMPILAATLEENKQVKDSLALYQLALVRIPRLKLKKNMEDNMELDDEKAEGTKPYKVVKNHPGCKDGKPYGVLNTDTNELKGCSDSEDMANQHMAALYAAENKGEEDKGGPGSGRRPGGTHKTDSTKKPKKAGTRKSKKELAQALVDALVDDVPFEEDEVQKAFEETIEEGEKEQSLSAKVQEVGMAFREQFNPKPPDMPKQMPMYHWVKEVYPDYAIVGCDMGNGNKLYKVNYTTDENGQLKFADKSKWAEMEVQLVPTGNVGAKGLMAGYDENAKSFSEWVEDYYNLADKSIGDLTEEEAVKAVWSAAFVNNLPDSSFLHIVPDCGDKDEEGKTKPRSCRMFPVKDANGQIDLPHLRNAIARAPQASTIPEDVRMKIQKKAQAMLADANKEDGEKAGRKVKKTMIDKLKSAWSTIKELIDWAEPEEDDEEEDMPMMGGMMTGKSAIGIKKVGNDWWYISWSTNAFEDREKEIFSTKSLEKYVAEAETKEDRGYFNLWHIPNTDFAEKKWQGVAGRFLIEAGPFLKDEKGKSALKFFKQYADGHKELAPEGWGCSPEYRYLPEERKSGIYENIWITRTSTLPKMAAANIWTQGGITMALTKEQTKAAELIFGEELTKDIVKTAEAKTKELEEAGVAHKSKDEEKPVEEQPKTEEVKIEVTEEDLVTQLAQKMAVDWEPLKAMLQGLVDSQKNLESKLTVLETKVSEETKVEAQKAKEESPKYVWRLFERASEAEKTVVAKDDPLYDKKPAEAPLKDKSGAAHFFGK